MAELGNSEGIMEYKGFTAGPVEVDPDDNTLSGTVGGLRDVIHFESSTAEEIEKAFHDSVDAYLELHGENGQNL